MDCALFLVVGIPLTSSGKEVHPGTPLFSTVGFRGVNVARFDTVGKFEVILFSGGFCSGYLHFALSFPKSPRLVRCRLNTPPVSSHFSACPHDHCRRLPKPQRLSSIATLNTVHHVFGCNVQKEQGEEGYGPQRDIEASSRQDFTTGARRRRGEGSGSGNWCVICSALCYAVALSRLPLVCVCGGPRLTYPVFVYRT